MASSAELKAERFGLVRDTIPFRTKPRSLARRELKARLLPIANAVVCAERDLLASRQQERFAALHSVFLIERPRVHEVLQHDHEHPLRDTADIHPIRKSARGTGREEVGC